MPSNWAKGFTKETHPSVRKISDTMIRRRIDNFAQWRAMARKSGILKSDYQVLKKNGDLAELLGVIYGDGNIEKFPRTERLVIAANSNNTGFIERYSMITKNLFQKEPYCIKSKKVNCVRISIYEKEISKRLGIPTGNKKNLNVVMPLWIAKDQNLIRRLLRGLFEAEGSFNVHKPTCTYKLIFSNKNNSLLKIVFDGLNMLGFNPHRSKHKIQLSRKDEVYRCIDSLEFRKYT